MDKKRDGKIIFDMLQTLLIMYIVTFLLLLLLAVVLYKFEPPEMVFRIWLIAIYILSGLAGGIVIGKKRKSRKYLWGAVTGLIYYGVLLAVSFLLKRDMDLEMTQKLTTFVLCVVSSVFGGMIS